jgi:hypothetical protein
MASTQFNRAGLAAVFLAATCTACSSALEADQRFYIGISRAEPAAAAGMKPASEATSISTPCDDLARQWVPTEPVPSTTDGTSVVDASPGEQYSLLWGQDASNIWAIGTTQPLTHGETAHGDLECDPNRFFAAPIAKHFDGHSWTLADFPSTTDSHDLHGSGVDNVWVVGAMGEAWQFDGAEWRLHDLRAEVGFEASSDPCDEFSLTAVWATAPDDVWVVGYAASGSLQPLLMHYDGEHWARHAVSGSDALLSVWASDREHAWVAGTRGTLQTFTDSQWQPEPKITESDLTSIYGASPRSVWVAGVSGALARFDGETWKTPSDAPQNLTYTQGMVARSSDDLWMINGSVVTEGQNISYVQSVDHWDGGQWCSVRSTTDTNAMFSDLWLSPEGQLWAAGTSLQRLL